MKALSYPITFASLAFLAASANAQPGGFHTPTTGFVYSQGSRSVRPLVGIPGAAYPGPAVLNDVSGAWIAPGGKWAFVTRADHPAFVRGLMDPVPSESAPEGLIDGVDRVVWNRDGSFAVLYSSSGVRLQRVHLADDQISAEAPVDLSSWGSPVTLAIDPAGRRIAFGITGSGVFAIEGDQGPVLVVSMDRPAAMTFSDSGRLYAVDAGMRRIVQFGMDLSPSDFASVEAADGVEFDPVGLAVSGSDKYLMVADRGTQSLRVFEIATQMPAGAIGLDFAPVAVERLSTGATFTLNRPRAAEWLLVLDATDMPRVYFVPGGEEKAQ
jgi:hypothetical protein